ncbi:MAG: DUF4058 family protein [Anaerolineales bacterium]
MPSPFPGMDPFLEDPARWSDFHPTFLVTMRRHLSRLVSPSFHVDIQEQVYITETTGGTPWRIAPDVFVTVGQGAQPAVVGGAIAITLPTIEEPLPESAFRYRFLEIRDARTQEVVTILELLSPGNKTAGSFHQDAFLKKRESVWASNTHWLEIDLLRRGRRPQEVRRPSDYYALLKRAEVADRLEVWYFDLRDTMPVIAVPLRAPFEDVPLDLQSVFAETYQDGFYVSKLEYDDQPPPPRLRPADAAWVRERVEVWRAKHDQ